MRSAKGFLASVAGASILAISMASVALAEDAPAPAAAPVAHGKKAADPDNPLNPFSSRGATLPLILRQLQSDGVKLTALGERGGFKGYLAEAANGRFQALYPSPDGEFVVAGMLFESGGHHVTGDQVAEMLRRFGDAARGTQGLDVSQLPEIPAAETYEKVDMPILDWFKSKGMKVTDMKADDGGLKAYLVEAPSTEGAPGRMQVFYLAPDQRYAVAGILLKRNGGNVTGVQIGKMQERALQEAQIREQAGSTVDTGTNPPKAREDLAPVLQDQKAPAAKLPQGMTEEQAEPVKLQTSSEVSTKPVPDKPAADKSADANSVESMLIPSQPDNTASPEPAKLPAGVPQPATPAVEVSTEPPTSAERFKSSNITSEDFHNALRSAVWFTVGIKDKPAVYMVADPQCPFCHEAWRRLKPLVFAGKMQVRVILIAGLRGSDPLSRAILSRDDPSKAWLRGEGSIDGVKIDGLPQVGTPQWERSGKLLEMNANFIHRFNIANTPFLAYTAKDGSFITSRGIPDNFDAFLAALR